MTQTPFQKALAGLNEKQREAVETIYGPVMVIAGPGSGKTQLLSARIAYILQETDYLPQNILCLTFTDNAAKNMRERLASMIGQDAYKVAIHTFHSFGTEIINRFRTFSQAYNEAQALDTIAASRIIDTLLETLPWKHPYKPGFRASEIIKELLGDIADLKKSGLTAEKYKAIIEENAKTLEILEALIETSWKEIDVLGQKKEEKEKKISLFETLVEHISILAASLHKELYGYETLIALIARNLTEALTLTQESNSTKHMTAWRDSWTEKDYSGKRKLKEAGKLEKQYALADIYESYQKKLEETGYIDFSDMILQAISLLENYEVVRMSLAESYQCIMIDEFQDTNEAQMKLIDLIAGVNPDSPNIFAVGDDDQSIYKFQGANTKNLRDFATKYEETKLIILEKNYRSTKQIIETSRALLSESHDIGNIFPGVQKYFEAVSEETQAVQKKSFTTELEEISWIISDIEAKIGSGVAPENIAIITKKNKTLELFAKGLLSKKIPVNISKQESLLDIEEIRLILNILKLLKTLDESYTKENPELLLEILSHSCFDLNRLTLWNLSKKIYHAREVKTRSWIEQLRLHEDVTLRNIGHFFIELSQRARTQRLEDILDMITGASALSLPDEYGEVQESSHFQMSLLSGEKKSYVSPIYEYFFGNISAGENFKYARHLSNIKTLVDTIRSYKNQKMFLVIQDALEILSLLEKYSLSLDVSTLIGSQKSAIACITVYKAKGLEWKHVYVPCLSNSEYKMGRFGAITFPKNLPLQAEKDTMEDIERLVYTATTRAETYLTLSYSETNMQGKSLEALACIDTTEASWEAEKTPNIPDLELTLQIEQKDLVSLPYLGNEKDFLKDRIDKIFVMNATALQNFLDITTAGPEMFVKRTLLRFPQAKNISASYGSAIHKALEDFMRDFTQKASFSKMILLQSFETYLKKEGFDSTTYEEYSARGLENLEFLFGEITTQKYADIELEYDFRTAYGGVFLPDTDAAIQLTGKIDRIEILPDESLVITDYKTGGGFDGFDYKGADYLKVKQWKYHLQLCFYAVLFELSPRWKGYARKQYELFFVEKDRKENRFHRISEYIQQGEIERTKLLIRSVMKKIQNLDFPDILHYPKTLEGIRQFEEDLIEGKI